MEELGLWPSLLGYICGAGGILYLLIDKLIRQRKPKTEEKRDDCEVLRDTVRTLQRQVDRLDAELQDERDRHYELRDDYDQLQVENTELKALLFGYCTQCHALKAMKCKVHNCPNREPPSEYMDGGSIEENKELEELKHKFVHNFKAKHHLHETHEDGEEDMHCC